MDKTLKKKIPFNKPYIAGNEYEYIKTTLDNSNISGDGAFTQKCHEYLERKFNVKKALLTTSCTHALELAYLLIDIKPGDEIIVPSFTFVSTVNAFVLRGAKPVFVDIRPDTLNINEKLIIDKITKKTKAICLVHYAGVGCEMNKIMKIAKKYNLFVIEDAAQAINSKYQDQYLGSIGNFGAFSFHETKNIMCGEGGALLINDNKFIERAEVIREKGTNRSKFFRGEIDKYTWVDIGSSYLPSDILAAYLYAQLEKTKEICTIRKNIFNYYYESLSCLEKKGIAKLPTIPAHCTYNYHMFYLVFATKKERDKIMAKLNARGICAIFHYLPLHTSPMGQKFGYKSGDLPITEETSARVLRVPFYNTMTKILQNYVINHLIKALKD